MRIIVIIFFVFTAFSPRLSILGEENVLRDLPERRGVFTLGAVHDVATGGVGEVPAHSGLVPSDVLIAG